MRTIALTASVVLASSVLAACNPGSDDELTAMSFNIHHGEGEDEKLDLDRIAEVIEDSDADIVGLQEVDNNWERSDFTNQATELAEKLDMKAVFGDNLNVEGEGKDGSTAQYGNAVLVKGEIVEHENHYLPLLDESPAEVEASRSGAEGATEQRSLLEVTATIDGKTVDFFNTHFEHKNKALRDKQAEKVVEIVGQAENPTILVGDFNAIPNSQPMNIVIEGTGLTDTFAAKDKGDVVTSGDATRIDYILADDNFEIDEVEAIETDASDHLPVTAELTLKD